MHHGLTCIIAAVGLLFSSPPLVHTCDNASEFLSVPKSVTVNDGESLSFTCVIANVTISQWFLNNTPVNSVLQRDNYVLWSDCNSGKVYCGGTLFIKHTDKSLNGTQVYCQVVCNDLNVTLSPPATIIVKEASISDSVMIMESSSVALSPTPSSSQTHTIKPSVHFNETANIDITDPPMPVTEVLVQRVPLIAAVAAIAFTLGCVFGTICVVTIGRGVRRNKIHKHKYNKRRQIQISYPLQSTPDPTYSELTPPSSTSNASSNGSTTPSSNGSPNSNRAVQISSERRAERTRVSGSDRDYIAERLRCNRSRRRDNYYAELGMPGTPQEFNSTINTPDDNTSTNCGTTLETELTCIDIDALQAQCCTTPPPLPARPNQHHPPLLLTQDTPRCSSCIEVDLDELERAILEQD